MLEAGRHAAHAQLEQLLGGLAVGSGELAGAKEPERVDLQLGQDVDVRGPQIDAAAEARASLQQPLVAGEARQLLVDVRFIRLLLRGRDGPRPREFGFQNTVLVSRFFRMNRPSPMLDTTMMPLSKYG